MELETYGLDWPTGVEQWQIELKLFQNPQWEVGVKPRPEFHFIRAAQILWGKNNKKAQFKWHPWAVDMTNNAVQTKELSLCGPSSCGKCLHPDELVRMFDGTTKRAGDVVVGDLLVGDDSKPRRVLETHSGKDRMVKITPATGDPFLCTDDHILTLKRAKTSPRSWRKKGTIIDISVADYLKKSKTFRREYRLFNVGVDFDPQPVDFDPYVYGVWLGDGRKGGIEISLPDSKHIIREACLDYFTSIGYRCARYGEGEQTSYLFGTGKNSNNNPFLDFVRESSPSGKVILERYLNNSREVRLQVLAGLLDTDGYLHRSGTHFEICVTDNGLAEDVKRLAGSLGFRVTCRKKKSSEVKGGKEFESNRINILGDIHTIPTKLPHKRGKKKLSDSDSTCTGFKVEDAGIGEYAGFAVDGNKRFLMGNYTVTHNSEWMATWVILNYLTDPLHTLIYVTSTTIPRAKQKIWSRVVRYWNALPDHIRTVGKMVENPTPSIWSNDKDGKRIMSAGVHLVAAAAGQGREAQNKLQGSKANDATNYQNGRMLFVGDEFSDLSHAVIPLVSNLKSNPTFHMVASANPNHPYDPFSHLVEPVGGYETIDVDTSMWRTKRGGICLHFDDIKNPNWLAYRDHLESGKDPSEFQNPWPIKKGELVEEAFVGSDVNSIEFWRNFRGFWAPSGADDTIFTDTDIKGAKATDDFTNWMLSKQKIRVMGVDSAFSSGGDDTYATIVDMGWCKERNIPVVQIIAEEPILISAKSDKNPDQQVGEAVKGLLVKYNVEIYSLGFDSTVSSAANYLAVVLENNDFHRVSFRGSASDIPISDLDPAPANQRYGNRVSELWFFGRELIRRGQLYGISRETASELIVRKYDTTKFGEQSRLTAETKRDMKKRTGGKSPDRADALMIALDVLKTRYNLRCSATKLIYKSGSTQGRWLDFVEKQNSTRTLPRLSSSYTTEKKKTPILMQKTTRSRWGSRLNSGKRLGTLRR